MNNMNKGDVFIMFGFYLIFSIESSFYQDNINLFLLRIVVVKFNI